MSLTIRTWTLVALGGLSLCLFPRTAQAHWQPPVVNNKDFVRNNVHIRRSANTTVVNQESHVVTKDAAWNQVVLVNRTGPAGSNGHTVVLPRPGNALYVLSVGVNCNRVQPGKPADDHAPFARELATLFRQHGTALFGKVHTRVLAGRAATRKSILAGLDWLRQNVTPEDVTVVFLSSHGGYGNGNYLMAPAKTGAKDWKQDVVWGQEIREALLEIPGRKVLFLNTCDAAGILQAPVMASGLPNTEIVCCVRAHEVFGPAFAMDNALVRGLKGAAADHNGVVTLGSLEHYLQTQVKRVTKDREHVTIAHPRHLGANYGPAVTSLSGLALKLV